MFDAVQCFPQPIESSPPKLSAAQKDYKISVADPSTFGNKTVLYVDPVNNEPDPSISYSYVTAFTYMYCEEKGELSKEDVKANVKLQPLCGTFSYSEIPKFYEQVLGMTGTLDCMELFEYVYTFCTFDCVCSSLRSNIHCLHDLTRCFETLLV